MKPAWTLPVFLLFILACKNSVDKAHFIEGKTMGTSYHITYYGSLPPAVARKGIDSLLDAVNEEVSTYIPSSVISKFNRGKADTVIFLRKHPHFRANLLAAKEVYRLTDGFFDPTVMPLVNYWGFGYKAHRPPAKTDSVKVDSLLQLVGMDRLAFRQNSDTLVKTRSDIQLDFSAIAKGYAVDQVTEWLKEKGAPACFVEIGGEIRTSGKKPDGSIWTAGIAIPREDAPTTAYRTVVFLDNRAMATSGNYRNYYEVNGQKFSHTINPKTGYPERNNLLSASVLADNCMLADALATGFMAMGYEKAKKTADSLEGIDFIFKIGLKNGNIRTVFSDSTIIKTK